MPEYVELIAKCVANELSADMRLSTMDRARPQTMIARIIELRKEMHAQTEEVSVAAVAAAQSVQLVQAVQEVKEVKEVVIEAPPQVELAAAAERGGLPPVRKLTLITSQREWYASACWPGRPAGSDAFIMGQANR